MTTVRFVAPLTIAWAAISVSTLALAAEEPESKPDAVKMESENFELQVEIPRLNVSEYHRPYVAMWIQDKKKKAVVDLAVWYQINGPEEGFGTKWLPDLRTWWRRSGRNKEVPIDGVTSPTRPAGGHTLTFDNERFAQLAPGDYTLVVEAVREVGGRELIEIPFAWPAKKATTYRAEGKTELGTITLTVKP